MQTINDRIAIILNKSKMTKTAFAKSLNVSQQYISKLIKTGNPSTLLIDDICEKYRINKGWLIDGGPESDMFKVEFEIDELSDYVAEITEGRDPFIAEMLLKYKKLSSQHKQAIWEIYQEWTKKKED